MTEFTKLLRSFRRPSILVRAAHHGTSDYDRNRDLKRLLNGTTPAPQEAMKRLIAAEAKLEGARREGGADYSVARHVDVMIAMIAELRLIDRNQVA